LQKKILILGAGDHSKVVVETILLTIPDCEICLLDDIYSHLDKGQIKNKFSEYPLLGDLSIALNESILNEFKAAFVAIGVSKVRLYWLKKLESIGYDLPSFVHDSAWISPSASLGKGTIILAKSVLQTKAKLGDGVILNTSSSIDHHSKIDDGAHICPGVHVAGNVSVGKRSLVGIGSTVIQNLSIGDDVIVGAGSVVIKDIPNSLTVAGVPSKIINKI